PSWCMTGASQRPVPVTPWVEADVARAVRRWCCFVHSGGSFDAQETSTPRGVIFDVPVNCGDSSWHQACSIGSRMAMPTSPGRSRLIRAGERVRHAFLVFEV